jgi:secreted trypsin-like serine protease
MIFVLLFIFFITLILLINLDTNITEKPTIPSNLPSYEYPKQQKEEPTIPSIPPSYEYPKQPCHVENAVLKEECYAPQNELQLDRIIRGTTAYPGKWPSVAYIECEGRKFAGSLITASHILTCAHAKPNLNSKIYLGKFDLKSQEGLLVYPKNVCIHENYNEETYQNDICIISLTTPVENTQFISPICLNDKMSEFINVPATVVGWGETTSGLSNLLQETIVYAQKCNFTYNQETHLCFGSPETASGVCFGDSGGPLMISQNSMWIQIGIVSFGDFNCSTDKNAAYTNIAFYINWIKTKI